MNCFKKILIAVGLLLLLMEWSSCKKFVEVKAPDTSVNDENIYTSDATAIAALTGIYAQMSSNVRGTFGGTTGISLTTALSADELTLASVVTNEALNVGYKNQLRTGPNDSYGTQFWVGGFSYIFMCNAAIEGLNKSASLTPMIKSQLLGEAKFLRAFFFFYLVNFYGDAPLVLITNPNVNGTLSRSSKEQVYAQIIDDLKEVQNMLGPSFLDATLLRSTSERVRPTKWAATALLARTYLYMGQYSNAEAEANKIISHTVSFSLSLLNAVFLKNSSEAIWQLQPVDAGRNTEDAMTFILPSTGPNASVNPVYLSRQVLGAFEAGDGRRKAGGWVDSVNVGGTTYFYPAKYRATTISGSSFTEYLMMFRLAEQYLIRAEARAQLNNIQGAKDDLNVIRTRAGLPTTNANDQPSLLNAILKERQTELFTELGHRWLDLKRTGKVDEVMTIVTPLKGNPTGWKSWQQLYPIPFNDIQLNPNLVQNGGY
jgi:hypothetical protein